MQAAGEPRVVEEEEGEPRAPVTHQKRCLFRLGFNFFKDQNTSKTKPFCVSEPNILFLGLHPKTLKKELLKYTFEATLKRKEEDSKRFFFFFLFSLGKNSKKSRETFLENS